MSALSYIRELQRLCALQRSGGATSWAQGPHGADRVKLHRGSSFCWPHKGSHAAGLVECLVGVCHFSIRPGAAKV